MSNEHIPMELLTTMLKTFDELQEDVRSLSRDVSAMKIDIQYCLKSNPSIKPGMACKTLFDANGLVVGSDNLLVSDLPELCIDNIGGLREELDAIRASITKCTISNCSASDNADSAVIGCGTKVSWNKSGQIVSFGDLLASDIPELPIDKIKGLPEALQELEQNTSVKESQPVHNCTLPTTLLETKPMTMSDLPGDLLSRLNRIEAKLIEVPDLSLIHGLTSSYSKKLDSNTPITPGKFTKVAVDSNGLVTGGSSLEMTDLPDALTSEINSVQDALLNKAEQSTVTELMDTLSLNTQILEEIPNRLTKLEVSLGKKADDESLQSLKSDMIRLQETLNKINGSYPLDMLSIEMDNLKSTLAKLIDGLSSTGNGYYTDSSSKSNQDIS